MACGVSVGSTWSGSAPKASSGADNDYSPHQFTTASPPSVWPYAAE